jgi:hypothetical protein
MVTGFLWNVLLLIVDVLSPQWPAFFNTISYFVYMIGIAIYNEVQNIYLVVKVYQSARSKAKNDIGKAFRKLILLNTLMIVQDIFGMTIFVWAVLWAKDELQRIAYNISTAIQGIHGIVLMYLFVGLIELQFSDKLLKLKNQKRQRNHNVVKIPDTDTTKETQQSASDFPATEIQ